MILTAFYRDCLIVTARIKKADEGMKREKKIPWGPYILFTCVILTILLALAVFELYRTQTPGGQDEKQYDEYYVMIVENLKSDFWQEIYNAAYTAGLEEKVYVDLLGSNLSQNYNRYELMEIAIYSDVDGILVEADESARMRELINKAVNNGIPVVTINEDNADSMRLSYVGIGNYELGREYGRQVLEIARDGSVSAAVLVSSQAKDSSQNLVWSGIQETILQENKKKADVQLSTVVVDDSSNFAVEESIRDIFMKENVPDIIICLNEVNTVCLYQAVIDYNKVGDIAILGYYDNDTILKGIYRNVITSTISIDAGQMGRYCMEALTEYKKIGNTSEYFVADITLIDRENVSDFMGDKTNDQE